MSTDAAIAQLERLGFAVTRRKWGFAASLGNGVIDATDFGSGSFDGCMVSRKGADEHPASDWFADVFAPNLRRALKMLGVT